MITDPMVKKDLALEQLASYLSYHYSPYTEPTVDYFYDLLEQYYKDLQEHN